VVTLLRYEQSNPTASASASAVHPVHGARVFPITRFTSVSAVHPVHDARVFPITRFTPAIIHVVFRRRLVRVSQLREF
jgi:hypothetical protein